MPLYRCTAPTGTLDTKRRQGVVDAITSIHCELTGAPKTFVHVQFHDATGEEATPVVLHGGIRAGRTAETTAELVRRCVTTVAGILELSESDVSMRTSSTPASWIFEGGRVLPEPGEEEAWLTAEA
ncbi:MAG: tautomerase family protein [Acidimicrobiia bacterium]|nr:tautomerase family protein [Acidimicrobiia bacterium]